MVIFNSDFVKFLFSVMLRRKINITKCNTGEPVLVIDEQRAVEWGK